MCLLLIGAIVVLTAAVGPASPLTAATIHVPGDQPTIQQAINVAEQGDLILVAPGTYHERITFWAYGPGMTLQSEAGPEQTIIDGQWMGRVVTFETNWRQITVDGFTITHGSEVQSGGGIAGFAANFRLRNNIITNNRQTAYGGGGGGIWVDVTCHPATTIEWNLILDNLGSNGSGIYSGTGVIIRNNTIVGNASPDVEGGGGGILCDGCAIEHNIIAYNVAGNGGGIHCIGSLSVHCNDLYSNPGGNFYGGCGTEPDNFSADPEFCDPEYGDFTLNATSPCLPGQSPAGCGLVGAFDQGCGPVAVQPTTWGKIKATYR